MVIQGTKMDQDNFGSHPTASQIFARSLCSHHVSSSSRQDPSLPGSFLRPLQFNDSDTVKLITVVLVVLVDPKGWSCFTILDLKLTWILAFV